MAGYWPSSFFACLWTETKPISSHLDRTNLVNKGFIIWLLVKFCLRDTAGSPEQARWLHLARSGSQSQRAIWFILPAHGASHIIKLDIDCLFIATSGAYPMYCRVQRYYRRLPTCPRIILLVTRKQCWPTNCLFSRTVSQILF